jgi:type 2A phosphatase activator TIP41
LGSAEVKELNITYDWTYTTDYKGTLQRLVRRDAAEGMVQFERTEDATVEATEERIDLNKLREREPILWFEDVGLFEDELHDHGVSVMSIKVVGSDSAGGWI